MNNNVKKKFKLEDFEKEVAKKCYEKYSNENNALAATFNTILYKKMDKKLQERGSKLHISKLDFFQMFSILKIIRHSISLVEKETNLFSQENFHNFKPKLYFSHSLGFFIIPEFLKIWHFRMGL